MPGSVGCSLQMMTAWPCGYDWLVFSLLEEVGLLRGCRRRRSRELNEIS